MSVAVDVALLDSYDQVEQNRSAVARAENPFTLSDIRWW
jgi:hypothetical protein